MVLLHCYSESNNAKGFDKDRQDVNFFCSAMQRHPVRCCVGHSNVCKRTFLIALYHELCFSTVSLMTVVTNYKKIAVKSFCLVLVTTVLASDKFSDY